MGQITVTVNGRTYRLRCGDGEEARLAELADHLSLRVDRLAMDFGQHGDERLLLMAALLVTDEMLELKARLKALEQPASGIDERRDGRELAPDAGAPLEPPVLTAAEPVEPAAAATPPEAPARPAPPKPPAESPKRASLQARLAEARGEKPSRRPGAA